MMIWHRWRALASSVLAAVLSCCLFGAVWPLPTNAQDYPSKPIKLVVPFTAGSVQDLRARHIGRLLAPRLGQPIVIDNRPGASGAIGTTVVAKAKPDGYTLLLCTGSTHAGNAALMPDLPYDPIKDLAPVVRLVTTWGVIAVAPGSQVKTLQQLVALAKSKPRTLRYGAGASYAHILGELFGKRAGVELVHVPYKGDAQVLTDLLGDHIDVIFSTPLLLVPQIKSGRVRALAIAGPRRLPALPDVPTLTELGIHNSELPAWAGICAPTGVPVRITEQINRESLAAMLTPEVRVEVESQGYEVSSNTTGEFLVFIKADISRTVALVKELNIPPEQ